MFEMLTFLAKLYVVKKVIGAFSNTTSTIYVCYMPV